MKKYLFSLFLLMLILLSSCSKQQPIIIQEEVESDNDELSIDLVEEGHDNEEEEPLQFLELTINDQLITLSIDQIPILSNYLAQHANRNQAIQDMKLIKILPDDYDSLFLLSFACEDQSCSYLFLNTELLQSQLLADQANLVKVEPSPDLSKVLFIFERNLADKPWNLSKLIVYDIENWDEVTLTEDQTEKISLHAFRWPIFNAEWVNDDEIKLSLPDIDKPSPQALKEWSETEDQPEKEMITTVK